MSRQAPWIAIAALLLLVMGCRTLDPAGPYHGDKFLYNAHKTITSAYDVLASYVKWEFENRQALASRPEIKKSADYVRTNAQQWINSAIALADAYEANPNDQTRTALQKALDILNTALAQAAGYMAAPAPKPAAKIETPKQVIWESPYHNLLAEQPA